MTVSNTPRVAFGPLADRLNALLHDVEDYFAHAYPGIYIELTINDVPYGTDRDGVFCRQEKKVRLSESSIENRCNFVEAIIDFEDALRAHRDKRYSRLEQTVRHVEAYLASRSWSRTDPAGPRG